MITIAESDFHAAANRIAQAFMSLIEAVTEAETRLRYSGDTFNDQGCWSRANACWAAADALPAALAPLLLSIPTGAMTAPAPGTPSSLQNKAETVVTKDATGQVSTIPDRAISEMAALEAIRGERKQHALQFPESGDEELDHGNRMSWAGLSHAFSVVRALPDFVSPAPENDGGQRGEITHECISIAELDRLRGIERHYDTIVRLTAADQQEGQA